MPKQRSTSEPVMTNTAFSISELSRPNTPISRSKLYAEIATGRLVARKVGRRTIILKQDYDARLRNLPRVYVSDLTHEDAAPLAPRDEALVDQSELAGRLAGQLTLRCDTEL